MRAAFGSVAAPPSERPPLLSFNNLVEVHVLRSLRTEHGMSIGAVRQALEYSQKEMRIERLLLRGDLLTDAGDLFLDRDLVPQEAQTPALALTDLRPHALGLDWVARPWYAAVHGRTKTHAGWTSTGSALSQHRARLEGQLQNGNVVAPVDVLVGMGLLTREHLEDWRRGRVPYLERVINCNLTRLGRLLEPNRTSEPAPEANRG